MGLVYMSNNAVNLYQGGRGIDNLPSCMHYANKTKPTDVA